MNKIRKPLKSSILKGIALFAAALCVLLIIAQYVFLQRTLYSQYQKRIASILNAAQTMIDPDDMSECIRTGVKSERYLQTQTMLDSLKESSDVHYVYVVIPLNTEATDNMQNVIAGVTKEEYDSAPYPLVELNGLTGDDYSPAVAKKYIDAYDKEGISYFENSTVFGTDYTGLIALKDSRGNRVAALCVDCEASEIRGQIRENMLDILIIVLIVGILFATFFMVWADRKIVVPIHTLEKGVAEFVGENRDRYDPGMKTFSADSIRTDNEVESLAKAVEHMSLDMQEYVKNLVEKEKELARLSSMANRDELTHVGNRNAYDQYAEKLQLRMAEGHMEFGVILADTNGLKRINGEYGHDKGDLYLQKACRVICEVFHHSPVFRTGGDEFVVMLLGDDYVNRIMLIQDAQATYRQAAADEKLAPWEQVSVALGMAEYVEGTDRTVQDVYAKAEQQVQEIKDRMQARTTNKTGSVEIRN